MNWQEPPRDSHVWQERTYRDGQLNHARHGDYRVNRTGIDQWQAVFEPSDHHLPLVDRPDLGDAVVACRTHYAAMALINAGRGPVDPEKLYVRASASGPVAPLLHHYVVGIGQDGPVIRGPYVTEESRLNAARGLFDGDVSFLCALDVDGHHARIEAFGSEIEDEDAPEIEEDDDPADGAPATCSTCHGEGRLIDPALVGESEDDGLCPGCNGTGSVIPAEVRS